MSDDLSRSDAATLRANAECDGSREFIRLKGKTMHDRMLISHDDAAQFEANDSISLSMTSDKPQNMGLALLASCATGALTLACASHVSLDSVTAALQV